jgi:2-polyprenyl-6-methoxyphenol hydroxylase-like FAD-dependent oxidoreductase
MRDLAFGRKCEPQYIGQAVWRATVKRPQGVTSRVSFYGPRSKAGFNPVSETHMYIYLQQTLAEFVRISEHQLPTLMRQLLNEFGGLLAEAREEINSPDQIVYRPVTSHILPTPWHRGRIIIIGDAAHTATPQLAAGAGLAMEDSVVLAAVLTSGVPLQNALENFMSRRITGVGW